MAQDEKRALWYIKKIPLFQDVSHDTIHKLVQCVELKEVRRRQVVYLPGDPGQAVYFVNGGRVKISKVTRDGKELTLAYRGPGEVEIKGGGRVTLAGENTYTGDTIIDPGATRTKMRALAFPGEEPDNVKPPGVVAQAIVERLCADAPTGQKVRVEA